MLSHPPILLLSQQPLSHTRAAGLQGQASQQYIVLYWRAYDIIYPLMAAVMGSHTWSCFDTDLFTRFFTRRARLVAVCSVCDSVSHLMADWRRQHYFIYFPCRHSAVEREAECVRLGGYPCIALVFLCPLWGVITVLSLFSCISCGTLAQHLLLFWESAKTAIFVTSQPLLLEDSWLVPTHCSGHCSVLSDPQTAHVRGQVVDRFVVAAHLLLLMLV